MTKSGSIMHLKYLGAALALGLVASAPALAQSGSLIEGVWLTTEKSEMTFAPCVEGFCGYITKIVVPQHIIDKYGEELEAIGTNYTDAMNPDPALRNRPIQNLRILTLRQGADAWHFEGEIYNPEDGQTYAGFIEMLGPDQLKLKGCAMVVLCAEQVWTRVPVAD